MKKTKFYISVFDREQMKPVAKPVNGYFEYYAGLPLGFHKDDKKPSVWTVTELSSGIKITEGYTRTEALENVKPLLDKVELMLVNDKYNKYRDMIAAAYAN